MWKGQNQFSLNYSELLMLFAMNVIANFILFSKNNTENFNPKQVYTSIKSFNRWSITCLYLHENAFKVLRVLLF